MSDKLNAKNRQIKISVLKLLKYIEYISDKFSELSVLEKKELIVKLYRRFHITRENLNNINLFLYRLVKKKADQLLKAMNFNCLRCEESCCIFDQKVCKYEEFGVYKEDIYFIKENYNNIEGITFIREGFDLEGILNAFINTGIINNNQTITNAKFEQIKRFVSSELGLSGDLSLIPLNDTSYKCFYYDEKEKSCKIHNHKLLICHTFPFRIVNSIDKIGLQTCEDCKFIQEKLKLYGNEGFDKMLHSHKEFWSYSISIGIFLFAKGRLVIKNNSLEQDFSIIDSLYPKMKEMLNR